MRRSGWRQITAYGSAATCGAIFRRCERTRRPSSLALRRDPIRPRPASRIGSSGPLTVSPANMRRRATSGARASLCSNPAATMIWPFASGKTPASRQWCYLAIASWPLGNVRRAVSLVDGAHERLASVAHIGTHPYAKLHAAMFELMRGDRARAAQNGSETARLAREHDLPLWRAYGAFFEGLATAELGALGEGLSDMRRGVESLRQQGLLNFDGLYKIALAEAEARAGDRDRAIAILDEALATADRLGYRAFEAELHRARGEILLERDPANPAPAEEAFLTAIAVAKQQGTRSFELRAALCAGQALSIDRPPRRRPRRPRARARRLCADAGNAGDRRGAGAAGGAVGNRGGQGRSGAAAATDAAAGRLRQRALRRARLRRAGNDGSVRQSPRVGVWRQGRARAVGGRLRAVGRQLRARRVAVDAGARRRLSSATSRRDPIRPRPASRIASAGSLAGSPASIAKRGIIWNARSPCSNPAATTIWPFASDMDPASPRWSISRLRSWPLGEVDRAVSLIDAHADADRGPHPCRHARAWKTCTRPCSN